MLETIALLHDRERLKGPHDIELQGDLAFVAGKWGAFSILDVSDPERPEILGGITEGMDDPETVLPAGEICFLGTNDFYAIDVQNPTRPRILKQIAHEKIAAINGMVRWGDTILAANKRGFIDVFDVSDPADPVFVDALDTQERGGLLSPHDLDLWGERIFVADQRDKSPLKGRVYRFAEGDALLPCAEWAIEGAMEGEDLNGANRVVMDGDYAYVAANKVGRIGVIDIRNPEALVQVANVEVGFVSPCGMTLSGKVLYVGTGRLVEALDVSDPLHPVSLGYCNVFPQEARDNQNNRPGDAHDLVVKDGYVFVTGQNDSSLGVVKIVG
ncbi:MAG: hypothetical protein O7G87_22870 [bacterium]|nr:hypothetical protein [bacterium]